MSLWSEVHPKNKCLYYSRDNQTPKHIFVMCVFGKILTKYFILFTSVRTVNDIIKCKHTAFSFPFGWIIQRFAQWIFATLYTYTMRYIYISFINKISRVLADAWRVSILDQNYLNCCKSIRENSVMRRWQAFLCSWRFFFLITYARRIWRIIALCGLFLLEKKTSFLERNAYGGARKWAV